MAQNISIQEGGLSKQFGQINKLKISNSGGGESLWVPEDDVQTKSLFVDKNGTYYASKDECYGYDEVSVNITNEVFGYDDDDNLWDIDVDEDGFLEDEMIPSSIAITVPAERLIFIDGEKIDTKGMEVTAYYGDGSVWGTVPLDEITLEPTHADISKATKEAELLSTSLSWLEDALPLKLGRNGQTIHTDRGGQYDQFKAIASGGVRSVTLRYREEGRENFALVFASKSSGKWGQSLIHNPQPTLNQDLYEGTVTGDKVFYADVFWNMGGNITYNESPLNDADFRQGAEGWYITLAWEILYGNVKDDFMQTIKVMWERIDGEVLETEYEIKVVENPIGNITPPNSGGGGSSGGSW